MEICDKLINVFLQVPPWIVITHHDCVNKSELHCYLLIDFKLVFKSFGLIFFSLTNKTFIL